MASKVSPPVDSVQPIDTASLKGKSVLITGGADGIGAGLVRALAAAGCYVTIADVNISKGQQLEAEVLGLGQKAKFVETDVTVWASLAHAFKTAVLSSPHRGLDIVFPNAGVVDPPIVDPKDNTPTSLDVDPVEPGLRVYKINVLAVAWCISLAVHYFKLPVADDAPKGRKAIILTGSLASYMDPGLDTYGSSKFAVRALFKGLRWTLPELGARINMVAPTYVRTALLNPVIDDMIKRGVKLAEVEDVVDVMLRLASDDSVNGRSVGVKRGGFFDYYDDYRGNQGCDALRTFVESGDIGPSTILRD